MDEYNVEYLLHIKTEESSIDSYKFIPNTVMKKEDFENFVRENADDSVEQYLFAYPYDNLILGTPLELIQFRSPQSSKSITMVKDVKSSASYDYGNEIPQYLIICVSDQIVKSIRKQYTNTFALQPEDQKHIEEVYIYPYILATFVLPLKSGFSKSQNSTDKDKPTFTPEYGEIKTKYKNATRTRKLFQD